MWYESYLFPKLLSQGWMYVLAALSALFGLAVVTLAFSLGTAETRAATKSIPVTHTGAFSYTADVPASAAYPDSKLHLGQPAFFGQINTVDFSFHYKLETSSPHAINGIVQVVAVIRNPQTGWRRITELVPGAGFSGDQAYSTWQIELSKISALLDELETSSGVRSPTYDTEIAVLVEVWGTVEGQVFQRDFAPALPGRIIPQLALYLLPPAKTLQETDQGVFHDQLPLRGNAPDYLTSAANPRVVEAVILPGIEENQLQIVGLQIPVSGFRLFAGIATLLIGILEIGLLSLMLIATKADLLTKILIKERGNFVDTTSSGLKGDESVVVVQKFGDLLRVAAPVQAHILHTVEGTHHIFLVRDGFAVYRYEIDEQPDLGEQGTEMLPARTGGRGSATPS